MKLLGPFPRKVELAILGIVTLVCANSAYQLFLAAPSNPAVNAASRGPAGVVGRGESFQIIDLGCLKDGMRFPVPSDRARLKGSWCATGSAPTTTAPRQFVVENPNSHHRAEVYFEKTWPRFTTDFIPLAPGTNEIMLHITDRDGIKREFKISVQKN